MKRRVILMLCMVFCLASVLAGCSLTRENPDLAESKLVKESKEFVNQFWDAAQRESQKTQYVDIIDQLGGVEKFEEQYKGVATEEQIKQVVDVYNDYKDYEKAKKKFGDFVKIVDTGYSLASDSASVTVTVKTEKKDKVVFTMNYDKHGEMTEHKYEEYRSVGQTMGKAGLNTVMSMAIVFCVLIFIALIISCFKFINAAQQKPAAETVEAPAPAPVEETIEEDLTDDLELVAVIAAAIAAAEEMESPDGLIVRSIVRR